MKLAIIAFCILAMAVPVFANDLKNVPTENGSASDRTDCDVSGCDYYFGDFYTWAEVNSEFYRVGPLTTGGSCTITNVVLEIDIEQTWIGDLIIDLYYDEDMDGTYDYGPVSALCRPQLDGCPIDDCCGCSGDAFGVYTFGDDGADPMGEVDCPAAIPNGCYMPAIESAGFAATFAGATAGGHWYLEILDGAAGDETYLNGFGVYVCCGTTASESTTWDQIKTVY